MDDPHVTSQLELERGIAQLEECFESLADSNARVSKIGLRKLRQIRKLVLEAEKSDARLHVRSIARGAAHELVAETVRWILETLIRFFPALFEWVKAYDIRNYGQNTPSVRGPQPATTGEARGYFRLIPISFRV